MADVRTLPDAETAPEAPPSPVHTTIHREDYRPPDWLVPEISLDFALDGESTRIRATLHVERNGQHSRPLRLDGDELTPLEVLVDGSDAAWRMDGPTLVLDIEGDRAAVQTEVIIHAASNTK